MSAQLGRSSAFAYAKETVRLTGQTAPTKYFPWSEFSVQKTLTYVDNDDAFGIPLSQTQKLLETGTVGGNFGAKLDPNYIGEMLFHFFGKVTTTTLVASTVYQHVFQFENSASFATFTSFFKRAGGTNWVAMNGCKVVSLDLVAQVDSASTMSASIMGLSEVDGISAPTVSYTAPSLFQSRHASLRFANTLALLDSATPKDVVSASANFVNNAEIDKSIGEFNGVDHFGKDQNYTLTASMKVKDTDIYDWQETAGATTKKAVRLQWLNPAVDLGGGNNPSIKIDFPPSVIQATQTVALNDMMGVDITVNADYDFANAKPVTVTLVNGIASY